jgi:hypothetical protein
LSKYTPLQVYLSGRPDAETAMSFADVEQVLGFSLPPAARRYRAWWSNNPTNSVITNAWLGAGFRSAQVDMAGQTLRFVRAAPGAQGRAAGGRSGPSPVEALRRALAGTVRFAEGEEAEA